MVYINSVPKTRHKGIEQSTHYLLISVIVWGNIWNGFFSKTGTHGGFSEILTLFTTLFLPLRKKNKTDIFSKLRSQFSMLK